MAKSIKPFPVTNGMDERGPREGTPFKYLENLQYIKNSLTLRAGVHTMGCPPANTVLWETLEIDADIYEVVVTSDRYVHVFKNAIRSLRELLPTWTGGTISASVLGNVVALWDKEQVVRMETPPAITNPNAGFIIVTSPVDYLSTITIKSSAGTITIAIGDPDVDGVALTDASRAVEAVAKKIAAGFGAGGGTVADIAQTALTAANTYYAELNPATEIKYDFAWTSLQDAITASATANDALLSITTPEQKAIAHEYWLNKVAETIAEMLLVSVAGNANYVPGTDYTLQVNIDTLAASIEKTTLTGLRTTADGYATNATNALLTTGDESARLAAAAAQATLLADLNLYASTWWALSADPGGFNDAFQGIMAKAYVQAMGASAPTPAGRYLHKGNVVYIPDITGISITKGNEYLTLLSGTVLGPTDLPRYAPLGATLKMEPIPGKGTVCYIKATPLLSTTSDLMQEVSWEECCDPTEPSSLDRTTMPVLIDLKPAIHAWNLPSDSASYWAKRKAGDHLLCPIPQIVDNKITDIGRGANRLLLLGNNSSITSSELGHRNNIFRVSALQLYPTDPISTTVSGEKPAHLYKIVHWGMHLALLGASAIFRFDTSSGIDATLIKISRACGWSGPKAIAVATEADLILIGEGIHVISYGVYGTRVELENQAMNINVPANPSKAFYDSTRKALYILYGNKLLVGWYNGKTWAWGWYVFPEVNNILNGWITQEHLRLFVEGYGLSLIEMSLHDAAITDMSTDRTVQDGITWYANWTLGSTYTTPAEDRSFAVWGTGNLLSYSGNNILAVIQVAGPDSLTLGSNRIGAVTFTCRGVTRLNCNGGNYNNYTVYGIDTFAEKIEITNTQIKVPCSLVSAHDYLTLTMSSGEINMCTLSSYSSKLNSGPGG